MLVELRVRNLGVIEDLDLVFEAGMTALTGETGAGKTLVVEALELLLGGRAEATMVRAGAREAVVEGRFADGDDEIVLSRAVPVSGRSRAYVDGEMRPAGALALLGAGLVDLHGQHSQQSLLAKGPQRDALDRFAGVDLAPLRQARHELDRLVDEHGALGGDPREVAHSLDLLRFQSAEIARAGIADPAEGERLVAEEAALSSVEDAREALAAVRVQLSGDEGPHVEDVLGLASARLAKFTRSSAVAERLAALGTELSDVSSEIRRLEDQAESDPARLEEVRERLRLFGELRRKYGPSLGEVIGFGEDAGGRLAVLESADEARAALEAQIDTARGRLAEAEEVVGSARRAAAPALSRAAEECLHQLGLTAARLEVRVGDDRAGGDVELSLGANPGEPALPLSKVASGGELSRAMLAIRLVLTAGPPTLVFDEVDAGIGGFAALAIGRALQRVSRDHQVLVVTHLAQVAAFADHHVALDKHTLRGRTLTRARPVGGSERLAEVSRMLSGQPDSTAAQQHAKELLETAGRSVTSPGGSDSLSPRSDGR